MSEQNSSATGPMRAPKQNTEKQKAKAFVNYRIPDPNNPEENLLRSSKGFPVYDNQYTTLEEKALIELAEANGGTAVIMAELRIVIAQEKPERLDISAMQELVQKKAV
jgi:hypothetical protein